MPKRTRKPKFPAGPARDLFESVDADYRMSPADRSLLEQACWCLVRIEAARAALHESGLTVLDRSGIPKEHPAAASERAYTNQFRLIARELGLVLEPPEVRGPRDRTYE